MSALIVFTLGVVVGVVFRKPMGYAITKMLTYVQRKMSET